MMLILALTIDGTDPADLIRKFEERAKSASGYQADFEVSDSRLKAKGTGRISIRYPTHMKFKLDWDRERYEVVQTPAGATEIEHSAQEYYEWIPGEAYGAPAGKVSAYVTLGLPVIVAMGSVQRFMGGELPAFQFMGKEKIDGIETTHASSRNLSLWLTDDGRLLKSTQNLTTMEGLTYTVSYRFSNVRAATDPFELRPPAGYSMIGLMREPWSVQIGAPFPLDGWSDSGRATKLSTGKPQVLVYVSKDCPNCAALMPEIVKVAKTHSVTLLADDSNAFASVAGRPKVLTATKGSVEDWIAAPGTPLTFLLDPDGKVTFSNYGFDRDRPSQWKRDLDRAIAEQKEEAEGE